MVINLQNAEKYFWKLATLVLVVAFWVQFKTIRDLKSEMVAFREQGTGLDAQEGHVAETTSADHQVIPQMSSSRIEFGQRLKDLEQAVAQLALGLDYLMEHGDVPLTANKIHNLASRFMDATISDKERIRALKLLRDNKALTDEVAQNAVGWLQTAADPNTQCELLKQLNGMTNAPLKPALLNLTGSQTASVRERTAESLRSFGGDAQVETALWAFVQNDPEKKVRDEAEKALLNGKISDTTLNVLRQRALASDAPLEERLVALRALNRAEAGVSDVIPVMVARAENTQDPAERAQTFRAFNGFKDPALKVPLVNGLQNLNPEVRKNAADALSSFATDPAIQEWLRYIAENDVDPRVRKEAANALPKTKK
jgi:HEAT repeat protein